MKLRAERWRQNPAKDAERAAQLAPYVVVVGKLRSREGGDAFRWLVEEFRVSLFAQELGTAEPVSAVKLDRALAALQHGIVVARTEPPPVAKPILAAGMTEKDRAGQKFRGAGSIVSAVRRYIGGASEGCDPEAEPHLAAVVSGFQTRVKPRS